MRPLVLLLILAACSVHATAPEAPMSSTAVPSPPPTPPPTRAEDVRETLFGVEVADPWRWLEPGDDAEVQDWQRAHTEVTRARLRALPQRRWLAARFQHLWRYDDESVPTPCLRSERVWVSTRRADQDKWVLRLRERADATEARVILDPNTWDETETLAGTWASPDCRYLAYGVARGGDENAVVRVLDLETMEHLPDQLTGWMHSIVAWKHDNSGFYYSSRPEKGSVPEGEEHYWHRAAWHPLGTDGTSDVVVHGHDEVKEYFHWVTVSEDGRWALLQRGRFDKTDALLVDLQDPEAEPVEVVAGLEHDHDIQIVEDRLLIVTDDGAPRRRVMVASVAEPGRASWTELVAEQEDTLQYVSATAGRLLAVYQRDTWTRIAVYDLDGTEQGSIELPAQGTAGVWGSWAREQTWVSFSSYAHPSTVYTWTPGGGLELYKESPLDIDPSGIVAEQTFYTSKDGTRVPMFLVHHRDASPDGDQPVLLTAYGGFNVSLLPGFTTVYAVWLEAGGVVAIPNLRGGGEYGRAWHEAGMRAQKQNVFDDFLAAAEHLIALGWTRPEKLAIRGGSNGGLLVAAAMTQRPDLFRAVSCEVPLTDMIRYHRFGFANIWEQEYGNALDAELFPHLLAYSPYHRVQPDTDYPALLATGSVNDARTDPVHARKFFAAVQASTGRGPDGERPVLLLVEDDSGHHGGVTIDTQVDQYADRMAFLMEQLGMRAP